MGGGCDQQSFGQGLQQKGCRGEKKGNQKGNQKRPGGEKKSMGVIIRGEREIWPNGGTGATGVRGDFWGKEVKKRGEKRFGVGGQGQERSSPQQGSMGGN